MLKTILIIVVIVVLLGLLWNFLIGTPTRHKVMGNWVQISENPDYTLSFQALSCKYTMGENTYFSTYSMNKDTIYTDENNWLIVLGEGKGKPCLNLVYHIDRIGNQDFEILSEVLVELDGAGTMVLAEYAREAQLEDFPPNYASELAHYYNDKEPVPTYMEVE